jgi:hypothetical protein
MLNKKEPVKIASLSTIFAPPDEVELPNGAVVEIRPLDALGYELLQEIETDPAKNGARIWDLVRECLPASVSDETVKKLTPGECGVITLVATGRIKEVEALAERMGKAEASTVETPEAPTSQIPPDSSAPLSGDSVAVT